MKKILIVFIVLILIILGFLIYESRLIYDEEAKDIENSSSVYSDESEDIVINTGDSFTITLESNPTTGFEWMAEITKGDVSYIKDEFVSAQDADIVGAGGIEYFTYKAGEIGESEISFMYARPWESVQPLERKIFHIIVQ